MRLKEIVVNEVSLVDKAANKKMFAFIKRDETKVEDKKEVVLEPAVIVKEPEVIVEPVVENKEEELTEEDMKAMESLYEQVKVLETKLQE
jgi:hypothetical protein